MIKEERCTFIAIIDTADNVIFKNVLICCFGSEVCRFRILSVSCMLLYAYDYGVGEQEVAVYIGLISYNLHFG